MLAHVKFYRVELNGIQFYSEDTIFFKGDYYSLSNMTSRRIHSSTWKISFENKFKSGFTIVAFLDELVHAFSCAYIEVWIHAGS